MNNKTNPTDSKNDRKITFGNYVMHVNPDKEKVYVTQSSELRFPSLVIGGLTYAGCYLKGLGPKSKFLGLTTLCVSAGLNHIIDSVMNKDKIVFDIE